MNISECHAKDKILSLLMPEDDGKFPSYTSDQLADLLKIAKHKALYLLDILIEDRLVRHMDLIAKETPLERKTVQINHRGMHFKSEGGYARLHAQKRRENWWQWAKMIAAVLNAALVILVAIWGIQIQKEANVKEQESVTRAELREWGVLLFKLLDSQSKNESTKRPIHAPTTLDK